MKDSGYSWVDNARRFGAVHPYLEEQLSTGLVFGNSTVDLNRPVLPNSDFTLIFWANMFGMNNSDKKVLIGDTNSIHIYIQDYRLYLSDGVNVVYLNSFFISHMTIMECMS